MRHNPLKLMAFSSAVALGMAAPSNSFAQTETMTATMITSSAITSNLVSGIDFGTWLIQIGTVDDAANDVTLTMTSDGTVTVTSGGLTDSQAVEITAGATEGVVTAQTPAPSVLTMTRSAEVAFTDTDVTLTNISYTTATEGPSTLAVAGTGPVTVLAGLTDETVTFGGVITFLTTPTDATHTATFDVTFTY